MHAFAWICVAAGVLLVVASFLVAAHAPTVNPWPSLVAGFCLTAFGVVVLTRRGTR